jgi:hypothetical protein
MKLQEWEWYDSIKCVNGDMCPDCPLNPVTGDPAHNKESCLLKANAELTQFKTMQELAEYRVGIKHQLRENGIEFDVKEPTVLLEKKLRRTS